jgi:hypothetical protein
MEKLEIFVVHFEGSWLRAGSWGVTAVKGGSVWLVVGQGAGCAGVVRIVSIGDSVGIRSCGRSLAAGIWDCVCCIWIR